MSLKTELESVLNEVDRILGEIEDDASHDLSWMEQKALDPYTCAVHFLTVYIIGKEPTVPPTEMGAAQTQGGTVTPTPTELK